MTGALFTVFAPERLLITAAAASASSGVMNGRIPYSAIREIRRVPMSTFTGKGRIWGSTTLRYWASLDPNRSAKDTALILDTGHRILPFITPDDADAAAAVISKLSGAKTVNSAPVIA